MATKDEDLSRVVRLLTELRTERGAAEALYLLRNAGLILNGQMAEAVVTARREGLSWQQIADPLMLTKAAVYEHYRSIDPQKEAAA